tara:strand:+ start:202 stop:471 length:270 start_codon:yes stop_codon:yes gene_type:complete
MNRFTNKFHRDIKEDSMIRQELKIDDGKINYKPYDTPTLDGGYWYWEKGGVRISEEDYDKLIERVNRHIEAVNKLAAAYEKKMLNRRSQ